MCVNFIRFYLVKQPNPFVVKYGWADNGLINFLNYIIPIYNFLG